MENTDYLTPIKVHKNAKPSWLGLPIILKAEFSNKKTDLVNFLEKEGIETRPIVTGNIARHPVVQKFPDIFAKNYPGADIIHDRGLYIGLSPMQKNMAIHRVIDVFNKARREIL